MGFFDASTWRGTGKPLPVLPQCGACGLYKKCLSPKMEPTGKGRRKILFVGEAPGKNEDEQGTQLIGQAGEVLRKILDDLDCDLDQCWKTNAVICRPPDNKMDKDFVDYCRPNLLNTIKELKPSVIVLLGLHAVRSLIGTEWTDDIGTMARWVGWTIPSVRYGAWLCPTYHPSYLLRSNEDPALVTVTRRHLENALRYENKPLRGHTYETLRKRVEVLPDVRATCRALARLKGAKGRCAFDYETTGLKPERKEQRIVSVSFCIEGKDTWAGDVDESCYEELSAVLRNERLSKIASNLKFEERWTRTKLGHGVAGWEWDTMLGAHVLDNRQNITSIKFQTYIRLGVGDYVHHIGNLLQAKSANALNRVLQIPAVDRNAYCGIDSLTEYMVGMQQMKEFK